MANDDDNFDCSNDGGLVLSALICSIVIAVCLVVMARVMWRKWSLSIFSPVKKDGEETLEMPPERFVARMRATAALTDKEVRQRAGTSGLVYLRFLRNTTFLFTACFLVLAVLLPTFATGENDYCGFAMLTMANLDSDARYWAVLVAVYAISLFTFRYVFINVQQYGAMGRSVVDTSRAGTTTVWLRKRVSLTHKAEAFASAEALHEAEATLAADVTARTGCTVLEAHLATNVGELAKLLAKHEATEMKLKKARATNKKREAKGKDRALMRVKFLRGPKIDAEKHWEEELAKLDGEIEETLSGERVPTTHAFVTFATTQDAMVVFLQNTQDRPLLLELLDNTERLGAHAFETLLGDAMRAGADLAEAAADATSSALKSVLSLDEDAEDAEDADAEKGAASVGASASASASASAEGKTSSEDVRRPLTLPVAAASSSPSSGKVLGETLPEWDVSLAPLAPEVVLYENLHVPDTSRFGRIVVVNVLTYVLLFFSGAIVSMLGNLETLTSLPVVGAGIEDVVDFYPLIRNLLTKWLPTLVLILFQILLITIVKAIVASLKLFDRVSFDVNVTVRLFSYLIVNILLAPVLTGIVSQIISDPSEIPTTLETTLIAQSGSLFMVFILQAWMGTGIELLRPGDVGTAVAMRVLGEDVAVNQAPFELCLLYARTLLIFTLTLLYIAINPLITLFGLVFFVSRYFVDKHNMCMVAEARPPRSYRVLRAVMLVVLAMLLLAQVAMFAVFSALENPALAVLGVLPPLTTVLAFMWTNRRFKEAAQRELQLMIDSSKTYQVGVDTPYVFPALHAYETRDGDGAEAGAGGANGGADAAAAAGDGAAKAYEAPGLAEVGAAAADAEASEE